MKEERKFRKSRQDECEEKECECDSSAHKCDCDESCDCGCQEGKECTCDGECHCGDGEECTCDDDCTCGEKECDCEEHHGHHHHHHEHKESEYLAMAQRLQADFENYRKHVAEQLDRERKEGVKSVIEAFLPCLDTFKEAKKNINDYKIMAGINMIEDKILDTLKTLKVEKIDAIGQKFDPHLHNVIAVMSNADKEEDIILEEYQSGWTMDGKVIRYSKVIVNKHS